MKSPRPLCPIILALALALLPSAMLAEDLSCLPAASENSGGGPTWYGQLQKEAHAALGRRAEKLEQLKTPQKIQAYQQELRKVFVQQLGGFPHRTPLNAQIVGRIPARGYRIEKVIFESQPQHHVTGNLYLPEGRGPFPGVLVSSGHSREAKAADYNQRFGIILAQHGMVALCFDPIGQGERSQILSAEGKRTIGSSTQEHFRVGTGSILVGKNTATYRVWDAIRAIDYLETRSEVDSQRIGMTGCSGGGTLTSYVMALDDRVVCAAPACYLTTFGRLIDTIGPQDAEQNIFAQLALGLDHPDYVILHAPKPTLISATSEDPFDIGGSWETLRQAKRIYTRLEASQAVDMVEADGGHGVQPENLAAIAQWMRRWLADDDAAAPRVAFEEFNILTEAELQCTEEGQVLLLPNERSVFDLNAQLAADLQPQRQQRWQSASREELLTAVRETAGIRPLEALAEPTVQQAGTVQREGYHIDKLVLRRGDGCPLPMLVFQPEAATAATAYLYVHDGGKAADAAPGGPMEALVRAGHQVVSLDLRGQGETADGRLDPTLGDWRTFFLAYLLGQSVVGAHAEDLMIVGRWMAQAPASTPRKIHLLASGRSGVAAAHAAALNSQFFAQLTLKGGPQSWTVTAGSVEEAKWLTTTVHAALQTYDLPDLIGSLPAGVEVKRVP